MSNSTVPVRGRRDALPTLLELATTSKGTVSCGEQDGGQGFGNDHDDAKDLFKKNKKRKLCIRKDVLSPKALSSPELPLMSIGNTYESECPSMTRKKACTILTLGKCRKLAGVNLWQNTLPHVVWCDTFEFLPVYDAAKIMLDCKSFHDAALWRLRKGSLSVPEDEPSLSAALRQIAKLENLHHSMHLVNKIQLNEGVHFLPLISQGLCGQYRQLEISTQCSMTISGVSPEKTSIVGQIRVKEAGVRLSIEGVSLENAFGSGLWVASESIIKVRRCVIDSCAKSGISASQGAQVSVSETEIKNCLEDGITSHGVGTNVFLSNVSISLTYDAIWCCADSVVEVRGSCSFHNNSSNGIRTRDAKSRIIVHSYDCQVYANDRGGLSTVEGGVIIGAERLLYEVE